MLTLNQKIKKTAIAMALAGSFGTNANAGVIYIDPSDFAFEKYCDLNNKVDQDLGNGVNYSLCHNGDKLGLLEITGLVDFIDYTEPMRIGLNENQIEDITLTNNNINFLHFNNGGSQSFGVMALGIDSLLVGYQLNEGLKFGDYLSGLNSSNPLSLTYGFDFNTGEVLNDINFKPEYKFNVIDSSNDVTPAPEPSTFGIFGLGLGALAYARRRQDKLSKDIFNILS